MKKTLSTTLQQSLASSAEFPSTLTHEVLPSTTTTLSQFLHKQLLDVARFVGTIQTDLGFGTCFLCKPPSDGDKPVLPVVVVPLHTVCDFKKLFSGGDLQDCFARNETMSVQFLGRDLQLHRVGVARVINDGISILARNFSMPSLGSFDFAILELKEDISERVGGGFALDRVNHFGSASSAAPVVTVSLSRGYGIDPDKMTQFYDVSGARASSHYVFLQEGSHQTSPRDSGKVVLQYKNDQWEVFSMNLGLDTCLGLQIGLKMETLRMYWRDQRFFGERLEPRMGFRLINIILHGDPISFTGANDTLVKIESHQGKHTIKGWPDYIGKKGTKFSASYDVTPTNLGVLKNAWETFNPAEKPVCAGYWYVQTSKSVSDNGDAGIGIQWQKIAGTEKSYWIHGYPCTVPKWDAYLKV